MNRFVRSIVRLAAILAIMLASGGCGQAVSVETERAKLRGKWEVVSEEVGGGIRVPADVGNQYEFAGDQFRVIGSSGEKGPWIKYRLNVTARPKEMDWSVKIIMRDGTIKMGTAKKIYSLDGNKLQICWLTIVTPKAQRPTALSSEYPNVLMTLRRIPFADNASGPQAPPVPVPPLP
jgi:uncharacterized protein (TIGR03067 family)